MAQSGAGVEKTAKKKISGKKMAVYAGLAVVAFVMWWGFQPLKGPPAFGLCRVFLEQRVSYPHELTVTQVEIREPLIRLYYTEVNPFGNHTRGILDCVFRADPQLGLVIGEARFNGTSVSETDLNRFNLSIPAIQANPPSLILPLPFSDGLEGLKDPKK
ncbi:hypothetical protein [Micavibrio aeruginosavorus]|uniref:hypothetical protein n=1 Tax=Micavibrio aeruginosavorus TaxID=349221 RepID=UPI003F4AD5E1